MLLMSLKCGVGPHPSTKIEEACMGGSELEMMKSVKMPLLLLTAGNDPDTLKDGGEVAAAVVANGGATVNFPEMVHGWVGRGDIVNDAAVKRDAEDALGRALAHFKAHL